MPHSNSAKKRVRQNEKRRLVNRSRKAELRTQIKRVQDAVEAGNAAAAQTELAKAMKIADKTAKQNTIHPNNAARIKSALTRAVAKLSK